MKTFLSLLTLLLLIFSISSWAAGKQPAAPLIFGDQPDACKQFIKDYDFTAQHLKNPVQWQLIPLRLLENPKEDYGWYFYKTLKINSDEGGKTVVFYKRIFKLKGIRQATVISLDDIIIYPPLSPKDFIKNDDFFDKMWSDLLYFLPESKTDTSQTTPPEYKAKLFKPRSKKDLYLNGKEVYLFITNEFSPWQQRYYLLLRFRSTKQRSLETSEVCHVQLR